MGALPAKKKTIAKKTASSKQQRGPIGIIRTDTVPIEDLQVYHANPRVGDVDEIAKSLHINSQFKPVVVNVGSKTGRPNEILAGNHTFLGARKELTWQQDGKMYEKPVWTHIVCSFVDVDDDDAKRIVLADNSTSDKAGYDQDVLAKLISDLPDISGTGFRQDEIDNILTSANVKPGDIDIDIPDFDPEALEQRAEERQQQLPERDRVKEGESEEKAEAQHARGADRPEKQDEEIDLEQIPVDAQMQVVLEMNEENLWRGDNRWDIPDLTRDMLMTTDEFPKNIQTWGGQDATPDDGKKWFLYNYSLGGRKGLPMDRTVMAFNTFDRKFYSWWDTPAYMTAKFLVMGLKYICVPDFSYYYNDPKAQHLISHYRGQWMGRFFQEAGLKVIPRLQFNYEDEGCLDYNMIGIPKNPPLLITSQQNVEHEEENGPKIAKMLKHCLDELQPEKLIYYSGPPGKRIMEGVKFDGEVVYVENYAAVRRGAVFDKKEGKKKLTAKQKRAIQDEQYKKAGIERPAKAKPRMTEDEIAEQEEARNQ